MHKTSVLISGRNEPYLGRTVEDVFLKAAGDIEVLVMLDGWEPDYEIKQRDNLRLFHRSVPKGMRCSLNTLAAEAKGKYLFKLDAHCMVGEGYDEILQKDMEEDWISVPSRYSLDVSKWDRKGHKVEYLYNTFPYVNDEKYGSGFHGKKWIGEDGIGRNMGKLEYYWMEDNRDHIRIDDIQASQGSCWFMTKAMYEKIDGEDEVHHSFYQEFNELGFKAWLSGGRCVVNKNTWYAHWHKDIPSRYGFSLGQKHETERFSTWLWMNNRWPKAIKTIQWFANEKFHPIPSWPRDWEKYIRDDNGFRIFDAEGHDGIKLNGRDYKSDLAQAQNQG